MLSAFAIHRLATDGTTLLDDVSLTLAAGDRLALEGASGAGKSLLLRALTLLDVMDSGRVEWRGETPCGASVPAFRRQVIYLAQNPAVTDGSVARQLALPWKFGSAGAGSFDRQQAVRLIVGAGREADFLSQRGDNLSGGEQQLLALVRALLLEPSVLLLDEPTAAMDNDTRAAAEQLLEEWIAGNDSRAWIWVSHDSAQLARMCRRSLRMASGRLAG